MGSIGAADGIIANMIWACSKPRSWAPAMKLRPVAGGRPNSDRADSARVRFPSAATRCDAASFSAFRLMAAMATGRSTNDRTQQRLLHADGEEMARWNRPPKSQLRTNVAGFLAPGEDLQSVFAAQTGRNPDHIRDTVRAMMLFPPLCFVVLYLVLRQHYRIVAVTNGGIHVFASSVFARARTVQLIESHARETPLVPRLSKKWASVELGAETVWVNMDDIHQICAANSLRPKPADLRVA